MKLQSLSQYIPNHSKDKPLVIAGPCSAEHKEQVLQTACDIQTQSYAQVFRAGIWKPRSRPGSFEGVGEEGLKWLQEVKKETGLLVATEVANPQHIELSLKYEVDILWIGARTTSNPFSIQTIAESLNGIDVPIWIKNPINPDLSLWLGAIERILNTGNTKVAAIHRGFYPYEETKLRNIPKWEVPIELKRNYPDLPIICDPSHIAGRVSYVQDICQKALDLNFEGLMIETHNHPQTALSDAQQQVTPSELKAILEQLIIRNINELTDELQQYREQIDSIDHQLLELLVQRMGIIRRIGEYKKGQNITILQLRRWESIIKTRTKFGKKTGLDERFVSDILQLIHKESIRLQNEIMNQHR